MRLTYSYAAGFAARLATDAYLATAGRAKVGFSVTGRDEAGQPILVGGPQGIAERNTMRYFLAIEAFLASLAAPPDAQVDARLAAWADGVDRHPRQLREMTRAAYLAMKRREIAEQHAATKHPQAPSRPSS